MTMHEFDISQVDLNLLVVFEALMQERHVGRAARRLALSQSAASHALGRLRRLFDDPLFVRNPRGVEPTPRSRELAQPVADALAQLRSVLGPREAFDPAKLQRTFRVAAHDYAMLVLMPSLMADLRDQAPGVDLRCVSIHPTEVIDGLDRGKLDFALGGFVGIGAERVKRTSLVVDRFVGVARKEHPRLHAGHMTLEDLADLPHALVSPGGEPYGDIDDALAAAGLRRRIAITTPSFLALAFIIGETDIIGVLPERLAMRVAGAASLALFDLPLEVEPFTCSMLALAPLAERPEMTWLTGLMAAGAGRGA